MFHSYTTFAAKFTGKEDGSAGDPYKITGKGTLCHH